MAAAPTREERRSSSRCCSPPPGLRPFMTGGQRRAVDWSVAPPTVTPDALDEADHCGKLVVRAVAVTGSFRYQPYQPGCLAHRRAPRRRDGRPLRGRRRCRRPRSDGGGTVAAAREWQALTRSRRRPSLRPRGAGLGGDAPDRRASGGSVHRVVRATVWDGPPTGVATCHAQASTLLHKRFPRSEWAAQTPVLVPPSRLRRGGAADREPAQPPDLLARLDDAAHQADPDDQSAPARIQTDEMPDARRRVGEARDDEQGADEIDDEVGHAGRLSSP